LGGAWPPLSLHRSTSDHELPLTGAMELHTDQLRYHHEVSPRGSWNYVLTTYDSYSTNQLIHVVPTENKQNMLDTSITLPWSAISSVGFFPVDIYLLWVSWTGQFRPGRGYLQKGL